jgi:hypothetical protein
MKGFVYCNVLEITIMGVLTALIFILIYHFYIQFYQNKFYNVDCYIWYGAQDNRTKKVDCSLITEDFCKSINCTFKKWNCGTPVCICG